MNRHMNDVIKKVENDYNEMPENTQYLSNLKARAGADLYDLKMKREKILKAIEYERNKTIHEQDVNHTNNK